MPKALLCFSAVALLSSAAGGVLAQPTTAQKATAEAYFDDGLRLMKSGNFAEACPKLEASQRIDAAVGTLLYLGECFEKQGKTASAWVTFREADALARSANQPQRAEMARVHAERLQAGLSRLTVELAPAAREIAGLQVRCGAVSLDAAMPSVTVPVDPGEVVVEASAPGYATLSRKLSVAAGANMAISIPVLARQASAAPTPIMAADAGNTPVAPSPAASSPVAAPTASAAAAAPVERHQSLVWPVTLGAIGVVGLGVGGVFGVKAINDARDANDLCPAAKCSEKRGETLMSDARREATISNVAVAVGAAGVAAAIVVYVLDRPRPSRDGVRFVPSVSQNHAGLWLEGPL